MTQCERLVAYMRDYGSITSAEAMSELGIMRLASRIADLKDMGIQIEARMVKGVNRFGQPTHYTRYSLKQ